MTARRYDEPLPREDVTPTNGNGHSDAPPGDEAKAQVLALDTSLALELTAGKVDELITEARAAAKFRDTATRWMTSAEGRLAKIENGITRILAALEKT